MHKRKHPLNRHLKSGGVCVLVSLTAPAIAQTADLEDEITVTSLRPMPTSEIASSVTILTKDQLDIRNAPFLADELRAVPGLGVSRSGARGALTQIRVRGAEANHTLVFVDGVEISDPVTGETDFGLWTRAAAGRVDVLRGEQSALYGSDAVGGVILIQTNRAQGMSFSAEGGSFNTARVDARLGFNRANTSGSFFGSGFTTEGVDTSGHDEEQDGAEAYAIGGSAETDLGADWRLNTIARYGFNKIESDADLDFDGLLDDSDREGEANQWIAGARLNGRAVGLHHTLGGQYTRVRRSDFNNDMFTDETLGERFKLTYSPSWEMELGKAQTQLNALIDYEDEDYQRVSVNTLFGDPNQQASFQTLGIAGEARISFGQTALSGSVRHDDNDDQFENATTWRVGVAHRITPQLKLRASAGSGVKNPTFTELFGFFPASFIGNPDLKPERSVSFEIGGDYTTERLDLSFTYFDATLENEIFTQFNPDFTSSAANRAGDSERSGVEFSARWHMSETLSVSGAYSHVNSTDDARAQEVRVPRNTASLSTVWQSRSKEGARVGLAIDYVGRQDDFFFTFPTQRVSLDSYVLLAATAAYPVTDRLSVTLRGENLLDEDAQDVFGFAKTGAAVFAGFTFR